jgi:hypothetical protein
MQVATTSSDYPFYKYNLIEENFPNDESYNLVYSYTNRFGTFNANNIYFFKDRNTSSVYGRLIFRIYEFATKPWLSSVSRINSSINDTKITRTTILCLNIGALAGKKLYTGLLTNAFDGCCAASSKISCIDLESVEKKAESLKNTIINSGILNVNEEILKRLATVIEDIYNLGELNFTECEKNICGYDSYKYIEKYLAVASFKLTNPIALSDSTLNIKENKNNLSNIQKECKIENCRYIPDILLNNKDVDYDIFRDV